MEISEEQMVKTGTVRKSILYRKKEPFHFERVLFQKGIMSHFKETWFTFFLFLV